MKFRIKLIIAVTSLLFIIAVVFFYSPAKAAVGRLMYSLRWTNGLVGYWSFDGQDMNWATGQAFDRSGQLNNGIVSGMATSTAVAPGVVGQALKFDGVDDYVDAGSNVSIRFDNSTDFSWSFWIKPNNLVGYQSIFSEYNSTNYKFLGLDQSVPGAIRFDYAPQADVTAAIITANVWQHLTFTHIANTTNYLVYVNGELKDTLVSIGSGVNTANKLIGISTSSQFPFNGLIDEVRIYNRALTANEIKYHYDRTAPAFRSQVNRSFKDKWKNGLVGYWTMDGQDMNWATGQAFDRSGQLNHGVVAGMATSTAPVPGIVGQALSFDGVDDYVDVVDNNNLQLTSLTVSAWTRASIDGTIFAKGDYQYGGYGLFYISTGKLRAQIQTALGTFQSQDSASIVWDGLWHHVAMTFDNSTQNLYVYLDGVQSGPKATGGAIYYTGTPFAAQIGRRQSAASPYRFNGLIDEVRVYNRALSAAEILEQYQKTAPAYRPQVNAPQKDKWKNGLVGYWSFDGQDVNWATGQAFDRSGQLNHGIVEGMATSTAPVPGIVGQALKFDGVDDGVYKNSIQGLNPSAITVLAWVKPELAKGTEQRNIVGTIYSSTDSWVIGLGWGYYNQFALWLYTTAWKSIYPSSTVVTGKDWYFVGFTYDAAGGANNLKLYVNGVIEGTNTQTGNITTTNLNTYIGYHRYSSGPVNFYSGLIDEVRIYNRALSAAEILEMYKSSRR